MNDDVLKGKWRQLRGRLKETWGVLTDDEFDEIDGRRDQLAGKLQERYGYSRARAEEEINRFLNDVERDF